MKQSMRASIDELISKGIDRSKIGYFVSATVLATPRISAIYDEGERTQKRNEAETNRKLHTGNLSLEEMNQIKQSAHETFLSISQSCQNQVHQILNEVIGKIIHDKNIGMVLPDNGEPLGTFDGCTNITDDMVGRLNE